MTDGEAEGSGVRVLVVDDDDLFRESLEENLRDAGFATASFSSGVEVLDHLEAGEKADLVLLDWKMPAMTGIEVLRTVRARGIDIPVIFLTALTDQIFEEAAFASGAVDFVEKARSFAILTRRIELILAGAKRLGEPREDREDQVMLRVGPLEIDRDSHLVLWKGRQVELTLAEFTIVHRLASRPGRDMSYREIYDLVRGEGFIAGEGSEGYRANVRTFVKRIRAKFRDHDDQFEEIENYPGYGYRWRAPAERGSPADR